MDDSFVNLGDEVILTLLWQSGASELVTVCVCVCVCVCALTCGREEDMSHNHGLCANTITQLCSPLGLELMVKLRTLITVFIFILKAEARDYGKGRYISDATCGVRPITMHWVSWPIRADCACRKEQSHIEIELRQRKFRMLGRHVIHVDFR